MSTAVIEHIEALKRLGKDLKAASRDLSRRDARFLVDFYYTIQDQRIRSAGQVRTASEQGEPHALLTWVFDSMRTLETGIKTAMGEFAAAYAAGQWLQAQHGIGPVLSAAMLSYFDIRKAPTVGHYWRFAGLDPTLGKPTKGEKLKYSKSLKSICCFRLGETMVKHSGSEKCYYGQLYAAYKPALAALNAQGKFAEYARERATTVGKTTVAHKKYSEGLLPDGHVHNRARRWMVKLFLSHLHHVMYVDYHGANPPAPYVFEHPELGDHRHLMTPPLWPGDYPGRSLRELYG